MKTVKCRSGLRGHQAKLRKNYNSKNEWLSYSGIYGLAKRLGYESTAQAWDENPIVEWSVNPADFRVV